MTDDQLKHMVNRFLGWRLPDNFSPDAGISFKKTFNDHLPQPTKHEPTGTNLLDATQADAMVRYMVEGMPPTRKVAFIKENTGALVASIQEDGDGAVEVQARGDGKFILTIHSRVGDTDRFEDMSATLESRHFELLGSIGQAETSSLPRPDEKSQP